MMFTAFLSQCLYIYDLYGTLFLKIELKRFVAL